jgi:predicted TIM-barrel fold metal-dependent hydrolase
MICDNHIHIGQFCETYYEPLEVLWSVLEQYVTNCAYSSTTTGEKNIKYSKVEKEISIAVNAFPASKFKPYFWYAPSYIKSGITAKNAFENLPYKGIKLHPKQSRWDFSDKSHAKALHSLFRYAGENKIPVLIHTGPDAFEKPELFEPFFIEYPNVKFILAHCRPVYESIAMFSLYKNVHGDTAFLPEGDLRKIVKAGFGKRIVLGIDFPITHYFTVKYGKPKGKWTLRKQYEKDAKGLQVINTD